MMALNHIIQPLRECNCSLSSFLGQTPNIFISNLVFTAWPWPMCGLSLLPAAAGSAFRPNVIWSCSSKPADKSNLTDLQLHVLQSLAAGNLTLTYIHQHCYLKEGNLITASIRTHLIPCCFCLCDCCALILRRHPQKANINERQSH